MMEASPDLNIDELNKLARLTDRAYDQAFEDAVESLIALLPAGQTVRFAKSYSPPG